MSYYINNTMSMGSDPFALPSATILTGMTELKMQSKAICAPIRYKGYWSFGQD